MNKERDADTWDGGEVIDGMVVRGDLTIGDLTEEEIAAFGPEAQAVVREQVAAKLAAAPKRRAMSPAVQAMVIGAAILGGGASGPMSLTREEREIRRAASRGSSRMQNERIAAAQAKRQRKAIKRSPAPPSGEVPSSVTSKNND